MQVIQKTRLHDGSIITGDDNTMIDIKKGQRYAIIAVEIPDGYRLVTEEEKKNKKRKGDLYLEYGRIWCRVCDNYRYSTDAIYITKEEPDVELKINGKDVKLSEETLKAIRDAVKM